MNLLAETSLEVTGDLLRSLGPTGAIVVVLGYTLRKMVIGLMPYIDRIVTAHATRQHVMAENQTKLTDGTLDIQRQVLEVVKASAVQIPNVCRAACPYDHPATNGDAPPDSRKTPTTRVQPQPRTRP